MESSFYMLYAENGSSPTYKHGSLESAQMEAERLAEKIGCKVFILEAVAMVELVRCSHTKLEPLSF